MREDSLFDIEYGYWFNQANERLYHRLDVLLNLVQLVGGSAAALAVMQDMPKVIVMAGFALALCAAIALLVQPSVKTEQHRVCKAQWRSLKGQSFAMNDGDIHRAVSELQGNGPTGLDVLAVPAFNKTLCATGSENAVRKLNFPQWFAAELS